MSFQKNYKNWKGSINRQFKDIYEALNYLLEKDKKELEQKNRKRIGY